MAMTNEEKEAIVKDVLNRIKASSQGVSELETVSSLNGVNSLPAMQGSKVVVAPVSLLSKPATDAAVKAEGAAKEAKEKADYASQKGEDAAKKASVAEKAAEEAGKAALEAENVINKYENTAGAALRGQRHVSPASWKMPLSNNCNPQVKAELLSMSVAPMSLLILLGTNIIMTGMYRVFLPSTCI